MKYKERKHAKRKYKQALLATVATMTLGVSTLGSTASAFADEKRTEEQPQSSIQEKNSASQGREIQGYLLKDGVQTPVYKNAGTYYDSKQDIAYPTLPSNPMGPIPTKGTVVTENASKSPTILYFSKFKIPAGLGVPEILVNRTFENIYLEDLGNGRVKIGSYNPKTLELKETIIAGGISIAIADFNMKGGGDAYFSDTKTKQETAFELVAGSSGVFPNIAGLKTIEGVKYGMSNEDSITAGLTLGVKAGAKAKAGIPGLGEAELSMEVSTQFQTSYGHKWNVSNELTKTKEMTFPGVKNKNYQYEYYALAQYQLRSTYTIKPGPSLQKLINEGSVVLANEKFKYSDERAYIAVTPGAATDSSLK
ncbi:hypothetical protein [Bacillus cereus]|uniref:hypothetical protein n=1 Tax=Bacillus cereus TaxID=1396 RepID=UPI00397FDF73